MGYTHYFRALQPNEDLARDAEALAEAAEASGVSIMGWDGECDPRFTADIIDFNGNAAFGEDYETFRIAAGDYDFNFCKTGRRAYDKVVGAVLIRAIVTEAEGAENISSDGNYDDWAESGAFELYEEVFGPLEPDEWDAINATLGWG